ncbi:MAG: STAS domain-containing protein [Xanthomonadales bacterium]|nr:STAS domain-containing protein [Gammaproteobacteria bacterium]MBT8057086.1 STAS domain-containing protein [Gammaproteobacteria bacterium]NNJ79380.1 STAS domain-containing protein [Xanthomonadales bacterium]NNL06021.1 STAS domain-containing protein [Xanthomonadales bacterium]
MSEEITFDSESPGVVRLAGPLTIDTCTRLFHQMEHHRERGIAIDILDLGDVTRVDSAGLALLLEWQSRRTAEGGRLRMKNAPSGLIHLAKLGNAVDLLEVSGKETAE